MTFQPGDLVRLKSGGPVMTISANRDDLGRLPGVYCSWFSGDNLHEGVFRAAQLEPAPVPHMVDHGYPLPNTTMVPYDYSGN